MAYIVCSTHVAANSFAKTRQEILLIRLHGKLFNDAECIHLLLLADALCDQRKCILTVYNQRNVASTQIARDHPHVLYLNWKMMLKQKTRSKTAKLC